MRERVKQVLEWIHATMLFPFLIPVVYLISDIKGADYGYVLYFKCLIIVIPVVVTGIASKKCKSLVTYLACSLAIEAVMLGLAWLLQPKEYGMVYVVGIGLESLFLAGKRFRDRLRMAKDRQELDNDPFWEPRFSVLNKPSFGTLGYFLGVYVIGVCFTGKAVCDMAFFTSFVYVFLVLVHIFLIENEDYLKMNRQVSGLPARRIYGIAGGMLGFFLILVFLVAIPSVFMIPMRQYTDIRTWFDDQPNVPVELEMETQIQDTMSVAEQMQLMLGGQEEPKELPQWVKAVVMLIFAAIVVGIIIMAIQEILKVFSDFRETYDENGDKIEVLEEEEAITFIKKGNNTADDLETRNVRKKYRKMIRKHRKDRPAVYESPSEIEENAGLLENEEMQRLHVEYEAVRYGK